MKSARSWKRIVAMSLLSASFNASAFDLLGSDIASLDVQNPGQCAAACAANGNCRAWTFVRAGLQAPGARCWLKNPVPAPSLNSVCRSDADCVSGYKQAGWCGDKTQGEVLACSPGTSCKPRISQSCSGSGTVQKCTSLQTPDYFCQ